MKHRFKTWAEAVAFIDTCGLSLRDIVQDYEEWVVDDFSGPKFRFESYKEAEEFANGAGVCTIGEEHGGWTVEVINPKPATFEVRTSLTFELVDVHGFLNDGIFWDLTLESAETGDKVSVKLTDDQWHISGFKLGDVLELMLRKEKL